VITRIVQGHSVRVYRKLKVGLVASYVHARSLRGNLKSLSTSNYVNLSRIAAVELVAPNALGNVWVMDIAASQSQIKDLKDLDIPVISVERKILIVGFASTVTTKKVSLKIISDRPLKSPASIWVSKDYEDGYQINMTASSNTTTIANIPFIITLNNGQIFGDDFLFWDNDSLPNNDDDDEASLTIGAINGVVTGDYVGGVSVQYVLNV